MKTKNILMIILLLFLPILIYISNINYKVYYVALGDSLAVGQNPYGKIGYGYSDYISNYLKNKNKLDFYTKNFAISGYRITDLIRDINNNKKTIINGETLTIKNAISKADIITVSIGGNDFFYKMRIDNLNMNFFDEQELKNYVDEVLIDMEKLLIILRKYCKEDIILTGYYNPLWQLQSKYSKEIESVFDYVNNKLKKLTNKYNVFYVDIYQMFKDNKDYLINPLDIHPSTKGYVAIGDKIISILKKYILT